MTEQKSNPKKTTFEDLWNAVRDKRAKHEELTEMEAAIESIAGDYVSHREQGIVVGDEEPSKIRQYYRLHNPLNWIQSEESILNADLIARSALWSNDAAYGGEPVWYCIRYSLQHTKFILWCPAIMVDPLVCDTLSAAMDAAQSEEDTLLARIMGNA